MASLEPWAIALIVIVVGILFLKYVGGYLLNLWSKQAYMKILKSPQTACDIDTFVGPKNPVHAPKVVFAHKFRFGNREASLDPISLEVADSPHVPGLLVTRKAGSPTSPRREDKNVKPLRELLLAAEDDKSKMPIVIATIRMGFGHHRLAYSAASWAIQTGRPTIFHDLISIHSPEADLLKDTDDLYSRFSRYASEIGGPIEKMWGSVMLSGNADALRIAAMSAAHLQPLLLAFPKDIPMITTHQLVALTASACGFTNVHNLVVDNYPQWFLTVPNTKNLVQGPVNYQAFLKMGVRPEELEWAGHWCPTELVQNVPGDCTRRIQRARVRATETNKPLRILIPVGGAGAQRKFIIGMIRILADYVRNEKVQLFLNAGDHKHMKEAFLEVLDECAFDFDQVNDIEGVRNFQQRLLDPSKEPAKVVTLFAFDEYFPAVATTDILCRVADVLSCKPSELAFYCLPKLHIRRVGDHEADSAQRAAELGEGTLEARELEDAVDYVNMFLERPDLLVSMNEAIINNNKIGIYDGCRKAVSMALAKYQ